MLYDEYRLKMARIAKFLSILNRFRVLILSVLFSVIALTSGFIGISGLVYDSMACPKSITVGETLQYSANAIFNKVTYEFSAANSNEWTTVQPTRPGDYFVRTYSKSVFGGNRYGETYPFTIEPKKVVVKVVEERIIYGELPTVSAKLCFEDTITCTKFKYGDLRQPTSTIKADESGIIAMDKDGNDVTSSYVFLPFESAISFDKRNLSIIFGDYTTEYNGQSFKYKAYTISPETPIAEGDIESIEIDCGPNAGESEIDPQVHILNLGLGNSLEVADVTANYNITVIKNKGQVNIQEKPIYITTESASKVYDGKPLSNGKYVLDNESKAFLESLGHRIEVIATTATTDVTAEGGIYNIILKFAVYDNDNNDLTANYKILNKDGYGKLSVTPRKVVIQSADDNTQVFDGTKKTSTYFNTILYNDSYQIVDGEEARVINSTYEILAGDYENVMEVGIFSSEGKDISTNYEIVYKYGTFTIRPRPVTVTTYNAEWVYDGNGHSSSEHQVKEGDLLDGHYVKASAYSTITNVGTIPNTMSFGVYDDEENIVTSNYDFHISAGTLKILPRPIDIAAESKGKVYDGTPLTGSHLVVVSADYPLLEGHVLHGETLGSQLEVGESENKIKDVKAVKVLNEQGEDFTLNYEITNTASGILAVYYREITVTANSRGKYYDGTPLSDNGYKVTSGEVMEGHTLNVTVEGEITTCGNIENAITSLAITQGDKDITANYKINQVSGGLLILRRPIIVSTQDKSFIYDGEIHTHNGYDIFSDYGIVEGQTPRVDNLAQIQNVKQNDVKNTMDMTIFSGEEDVTSNYDIRYSYGNLSIIPRPVEITTNSASIDYDDSILFDEGYNVTSDLSFLSSHIDILDSSKTPKIQYVQFDAQGNVVSVENKLDVQVYEGEENVTENYNLIYTYGTLTINPRPIEILTSNMSFVYDGLDHYGSSVNIRNFPENFMGRSLDPFDSEPPPPPSDDTVYITLNPCADTVFTHITEVGQKPNVLSGGVTIKKYKKAGDVKGERPEVGVDISDNFLVSYGETGIIEVVPRKIKVKVKDAEKVYDATQITPECITEYIEYEEETIDPANRERKRIYDEYLENKPMSPLHKLSVEYSECQVNVGSKIVEITSIKVVDMQGNDYTSNYDITTESGTHTITKRPIELQPLPKTKEYDGKQLSSGNAIGVDFKINNTLEGEGLVAGHIISEITYTNTITNVGEIQQSIDSVIIHTDRDVDVTANYEITRKSDIEDKLTITPRQIIFTVDSDKKIYDGQPLTKHSFTLSRTDGKNALVNMHEVDKTRLNYSPDAVITNVGTAVNTVLASSIRIVNKDDGLDYTDNYSVEVVDGTLTIEKRPVIVTTLSKEFVYDALEHYHLEYKVSDTTENSGIVLGQSHRADNTEGTYTTATDVSVVENEFFVKIFGDELEREETTSNYEITYVYGKLTVKKRLVYFKTLDDTFVYDGLPKTSRNKTIQEVFKGGDTGLVTFNGIKHKFFADNNDWASITNVYDNQEHNNVVKNVLIKYVPNTGDEIDVTNNYEIIVESYGTLEITPRPITVVADDDALVYNGDEQMGTKFKVFVKDGSLPLALAGHVIKGETNETRKDVGNCPVTIKSGTATVVGSNPKDNDNYTISYDTSKTATLTIIPRNITIVTDNGEWVYNALQHSKHGDNDYRVSSESEYTLAKTNGVAHTTKVDDYAKIVDVQYDESNNVIGIDNELTISIWCDSEEVTSNYTINYNYGTLIVYKRPVTVIATSKDMPTVSKVYDATPLRQPNYHATEGTTSEEEGLLTEAGHVLTAETVGEQTEVGSSPNTIVEGSVVIKNEYGREKTKNYEINTQAVDLIVTSRDIFLTTESKEWVYDGKPKSHGVYGSLPTTEDSGLVAGHRVVIDNSVNDPANNMLYGKTFILDAGEAANIIAFKILNSEDIDVTENYNTSPVGITQVINGEEVSNFPYYGILKVKPRTIYISTGSNEWVYDGQPHSDGSITAEQPTEDSGLAEGHSIVVMDITDLERDIVNGITTKTDAGEYLNVIDFVINDENGNEVTQNYNVNPIVEQSPTLEESVPVFANYPLWGILRILRRDITIISESASKDYDGTPLYCKKYTLQTESDLLAEHTLVLSGWESIIEGQAPNELKFKMIDTYSGKDNTSNYNVIGEWGTLIINGNSNTNIPPDGVLEDYKDKTIYIRPVDKVEVYYNGIELRADDKIEYNIYLRELGDLGYSYQVNCFGVLTTVGSADIEITHFAIYKSGEDVTSKFDIVQEKGVLTLLDPSMEILTVNYENQVTYDGEEHYFSEDSFMLFKDNEIAWDYDLEVIIDRANAKFVDCVEITQSAFKRLFIETNYIKFVITKNGVPIDSAKYYIDYNVLFEVGRRVLMITTPTQTRPYNGKPLTNVNCILGGDGLVAGHTVKAVEFTALTEIDEVPNVVKIAVYENGKNVTSNYRTVYNYGTLTVT